ncbi:Acid phosphatase [Cytospora mali]|uniref:Acid phosphatase n=1 Tax=Cytospora mali TaxID=578113 RepID=A0A194W6Y7_CYTMA|nr:Acid phosphatase [Valsa mali]
MGVRSIFQIASVAALAVGGSHGIRIIQSNDDGWAELYLRSFHDALLSSGHDAVISAPAENKSGRGSLDEDPEPRTDACEYDSCPANTDATTGTNSSDTRLNWVNSYPATSMRYGIDSIAPALWDGAAPEFAVAGPNVGSNLYLQNHFSGTVGAACYAAGTAGIPAIAFSGLSEGRLAWNVTPVPERSLVYADLAANLTNAVIESGAPYLPDGIFLNVNFPTVTGDCTAASAFKFVMSRIDPRTVLSAADVNTCGSTALPTELSVVETDGCYASVSVGLCSDKTTADAATQQIVLDKLDGLLTCLP